MLGESTTFGAGPDYPRTGGKRNRHPRCHHCLEPRSTVHTGSRHWCGFSNRRFQGRQSPGLGKTGTEMGLVPAVILGKEQKHGYAEHTVGSPPVRCRRCGVRVRAAGQDFPERGNDLRLDGIALLQS